jgi:hypothetical protein
VLRHLFLLFGHRSFPPGARSTFGWDAALVQE